MNGVAAKRPGGARKTDIVVSVAAFAKYEGIAAYRSIGVSRMMQLRVNTQR